ncbi:MAG TPA: ABC transporter permease subunit [Solirubrobacteraceae bacterium]|jgi:putative spermidine/putrescine transport system permease protein|nr:ABC transporter permease subunit [Solirubrobacteraceae bacterium]
MSALAKVSGIAVRGGQSAPKQRRARPRAWRVAILVFAAIFYLLPLLCAIKFSLINQKGHYGVQNYTVIANNSTLRASLFLSLEIAAVTAAVVVLLVFPTAVLVRLKLPKLTILMEAITILPIVVPPIVLAAGLLQMKETAPLWIVNDFFNHPMTILAPMYVVLAMPLVYRAIDTGLRAIDLHTLVDASRSLGASWPRTLLRVVLPNVQTAVLGGMFLTIAMVLGEVVIANLLDQSTLTFPLQMIQFASQDNAPGISVALTLMALAFTFLLLFMLTFLSRRRGAQSAGVI